MLGLGALGLAWSITTVAAYLPPILGTFTDSATLVGFVLSVNLTLFGLMRGDKSIKAEASKWGLAVGGARQAQASQNAQAEALHSAVEALKPPPPPAETESPSHE